MRFAALLLLLSAGCGPDRPPHEEFAGAQQGLLAGARPTDVSAAPPRFDSSEQVESVVSPGGFFRLHFSRSGPNAVAAGDLDGNGVPDAVEAVARTYDRVEAFYSGLGYRRPPDDSWIAGGAGGDGLFDVYLVDFAGRADGAFRLEGCLEEGTRCTGYMLQDNDFAGYGYSSYEEAVSTLASHEFFHAVQAAYSAQPGSVVGEGTAVWASERFEPALDDLENFSKAYVARPDRSLVVEPDGPALSFSYGSALFFQFLSERFGDGLLLAMWEEGARAPSAPWPSWLETALRRDRSADFDTAFAEFAQWNLATGARAHGGNGYARGEGYAELSVSATALPVDEPAVRVAPASARYFAVEGGVEAVSATFEPADGAPAEALHLLVAAVTDQSVLRVSRADGPERLTAEVTTLDATQVVVAVVDGRHEGTGRYGRLCITGVSTPEPCVPVGTETPPEKSGCQAAPGGWASVLVLGLGLVRWRRRVGR